MEFVVFYQISRDILNTNFLNDNILPCPFKFVLIQSKFPSQPYSFKKIFLFWICFSFTQSWHGLKVKKHVTDILDSSENYRMTSQWGNNIMYLYSISIMVLYSIYCYYSIFVYLLTYFKGVICVVLRFFKTFTFSLSALLRFFKTFTSY